MIKFALRRNLIYPLQLIIYNLLRKFETILLKFLFNFNDSLLYTPLIIFCAFFDWIQFMIWTVEIPFFINISESLVTRLSGITTIIDALFYFFILRLPIFRHHLFSLIIIGICLIIIILEFH